MSVRAKFKVVSRTQLEKGYVVKLQAVSSGSDENKTFFMRTPTATVDMQAVADAVAAKFDPGTEFYVDFTPASAEVAQ